MPKTRGNTRKRKTKTNRRKKTRKTAELQNNEAFMKSAMDKFRVIAENATRRNAQKRVPFLIPNKSRDWLPSRLTVHGINFDQPLTPMQILQKKSEGALEAKRDPNCLAKSHFCCSCVMFLSNGGRGDGPTGTMATGRVQPH